MADHWTAWSEEMYIKLGPRPTWRAAIIWIVDEFYWRTRRLAGDPEYIEFPNRTDYWEKSGAQNWAEYYGSRGRNPFPPFPWKW